MNQIREKKEALEEAIVNEMRKFEDETGMRIDEVSHVRHDGIRITSVLIKVRL